MIDEQAIRKRYLAIKDQQTEKGRRLFVAAEKAAAGYYGGTAAVCRATGVARSTIIRGATELHEAAPAISRVRRGGGGRPSVRSTDATVLDDLRRLVEPATMGDPMRPLLWVSKSREKLAAALRAMGHSICANTVATLLEALERVRLWKFELQKLADRTGGSDQTRLGGIDEPEPRHLRSGPRGGRRVTGSPAAADKV